MTKIKVYKSNGNLLGYFVDPKIVLYGKNEYELSGSFFNEKDELITKVEFNPQVMPHSGDLSEGENLTHKQLKNLYVQRGRQPVKMTGIGTT